MTQHPNLALRDFLAKEQPCSADELFDWIVVNRLANPLPELPATRDELRLSLGVLKSLRYVQEVGGAYSLLYPQPRELVAGQKELFA